jgi:hypothetical protein
VWEDPEIDELRCILDIIPDTVPCGLAKLVRKPCREVYFGSNQLPNCLLNVQQVLFQRRRYIPDDGVYPESSQTRGPGKKNSEKYRT